MAAPSGTNFGSKRALGAYGSSAAFRFEVPVRACGRRCRNFKSAALVLIGRRDHMRGLRLWNAGALLAGAIMLAAAAPAATAQTKWNLPAAYPADNPHSENLVAFAKDVEQATGGKLQITVHPAASLFKAPEIKRAVQTGQVQAGEVLISVHENEDPLFGIDVIPFLATSYEQSKKLWTATRPAIEKKLSAQGIIVLFAVPWAPQGIYAKK